jgi:hypothetical protein
MLLGTVVAPRLGGCPPVSFARLRRESRVGLHWLPLCHQLHGTMCLIFKASCSICASPLLLCHKGEAGLRCPLLSSNALRKNSFQEVLRSGMAFAHGRRAAVRSRPQGFPTAGDLRSESESQMVPEHCRDFRTSCTFCAVFRMRSMQA